MLSETGIKIIVRTNIGEFNKYDIESLYSDLANNLCRKDNVELYPHVLYNAHVQGQSKVVNRIDILDFISFIKHSWKSKKSKLYMLPGFISGKTPQFTGEMIVIKPSGELAVHPDYFNDDHFGSIYVGYKENFIRREKYLEELDRSSICLTCPILPACYKRRFALDANLCTKTEKAVCIENISRKMEEVYELVSHKKNTTVQ